MRTEKLSYFISSVPRDLVPSHIRQGQAHVEALFAIGGMLFSLRLFRNLYPDVVDQLACGNNAVGGVVVRGTAKPEKKRIGKNPVGELRLFQRGFVGLARRHNQPPFLPRQNLEIFVEKVEVVSIL